jgi:hypothetical protein
MTGSKGKEPGREAAAVDAVRTAQEGDAARTEKAARAARESAGSAPETDDSPKRQGDKLEKARDAAAGKPKGKG